MKPLKRAVIIPLSDAQLAGMIDTVTKTSGLSRQEAKEFIDESRSGECWKNDIYTVLKHQYDDGVVHLSIRRNDRGFPRDWRHFQQIKNQLIGDEEEAVEIYPAESRVVDAANQYHLWSIPGVRVPFGFQTGLRSNSSEPVIGSIQRQPSCET